MAEIDEGQYVDAEGTGQDPALRGEERGDYTEVELADGERAGRTVGEGSFTEGENADSVGAYTDTDPEA
ncbi:hypothetical protein [Galactobacter valiniphilus]|uniref:hypothetical protein n=1 Tax=Galactobacter valiniphilus TaxID=2676122 RepID=UPI003734E127